MRIKGLSGFLPPLLCPQTRSGRGCGPNCWCTDDSCSLSFGVWIRDTSNLSEPGSTLGASRRCDGSLQPGTTVAFFAAAQAALVRTGMECSSAGTCPCGFCDSSSLTAADCPGARYLLSHSK